MAKKKMIKVRAFELVTPRFGWDTFYHSMYDYEMIDKLFTSILKLDKGNRKYVNPNSSFNLGTYGQSLDADIVEGYFLTARYGVAQEHIDVPTQSSLGQIPETSGLEAEIYFMIDRKTGLLLVQEDHNKVFNVKLLNQFLRSHKEMIYPYIEEFNKLNRGDKSKNIENYTIHKNSMFKILTLPPTDFFDKLKEIESITHATLKLDSNTDKSKKDVSQILDQELSESGIDEYGLELRIQNAGKINVKTFEKYFEKIRELQLYDSFSVKGRLKKSGREITINQSPITKDFDIEVSYNNKGVVSTEDMRNEMTKIIKTDNPISFNKSAITWVTVGDDQNVKEAIQKEIAKRKERESSQNEQTG